MNGLHIVANLKDCDFDFSKEQDLFEFCKKACADNGLHVVGVSSYKFEPQGLTFTILLAESHLCIHTWPEYHSLALDIYTCNHSCDNNKKTTNIYDSILDMVKPKIIESIFLNRENLSIK